MNEICLEQLNTEAVIRNLTETTARTYPKQKWIDARQEDVLDAPYFHVVFTLPEELNALIYSNQKLLYDAMYHAVSGTLDELCAEKISWS